MNTYKEFVNNNDTIIIRDAREDDIPHLCEIYKYYTENTAISFECAAPDEEEFLSRMKRIKQFYPYLTAELNGQVIGYAYAAPFVGRKAYEHSCELTIYLDRDHLKYGCGKLLYNTLEEILSKMGIINMYACIGSTENEDEYLTNNSPEFHEYMGFRQVGFFGKCGRKFGRWYDMIWMEKLIGKHIDNCSEPISYNEL